MAGSDTTPSFGETQSDEFHECIKRLCTDEYTFTKKDRRRSNDPKLTTRRNICLDARPSIFERQALGIRGAVRDSGLECYATPLGSRQAVLPCE